MNQIINKYKAPGINLFVDEDNQQPGLNKDLDLNNNNKFNSLELTSDFESEES